MCGDFMLLKELTENLALARYDAHVGLDFYIAPRSTLRLPKVIDLLHVFWITLFPVHSVHICILRLHGT